MKGILIMEKLALLYSDVIRKLSSEKVRMVIMLATLALFILAAGAPQAGGGISARIIR